MFWAPPLVGIILLLKGRVILVLVKTWQRIRLGRTAAERAILFQRTPAHSNLGLLVIGDSTAVGTGATRPEDTIAGYFGQAYPDLRIMNVAKNGLHIHQLPAQLDPVAADHFDLAVTLIGGNDVVHFTNLAATPEYLDRFLAKLKFIARHSIIMTQGNIGNAPLFPIWLARILTGRARRLRELVQTATQRHDVEFLDVFVERSQDHWLKDRKRYYSDDWFHPSSAGYREWFEKIRDRATRLHWLPVV